MNLVNEIKKQPTLGEVSEMRGHLLVLVAALCECPVFFYAQRLLDRFGVRRLLVFAQGLFALRCAGKDVNCNVVVPGVTTTDAWGRLAATRGTTKDELVAAISGRLSPMGTVTPRQDGDGVAFLFSPAGRIVTGVSLPVDGGVHLKS